MVAVQYLWVSNIELIGLSPVVQVRLSSFGPLTSLTALPSHLSRPDVYASLTACKVGRKGV